MTVNIVDAGPRKISRSAEVNAPADEIFAIIADPRRHHELDGSGTVLQAIDGRSGWLLAPGSRCG